MIFAVPMAAVQDVPQRDLTPEPRASARADIRISETSRVPKPAAQLPAGTLPDPPQMRLARMPGFDDDAAYMRSIADRASELSALASQADKPAKRIDLLLAAANLILARQLEPACSTALLQIVDEGNVWKEAELRSALDRADTLIEQAFAAMIDEAFTAIEELREQEGPPADRLDELTRRIETLRAFASGLRAYLLPGDGAEAGRVTRRAASRLSPLLEDQSRPVAAAATLWQACLRSRESDPTRALSLLDLALAKPREQALPYAFFARLQRCRIIADRGGSASALALLLQIEERCDDWLTSDADRANAARASQLVQLQILIDWHTRLESSSEHDAERKWCADRISALREAAFDGDDNTVLRLTPAIPIVARPPDLDDPMPEATPEGG